MKISITFDTLQEGLAAIATLTGAGIEAEDATPATPGAVDPVLGVELDSNGFPWVAEVHASTKGKNQDGTWKAKRNVTPEARKAAETAALAHLKATAAPATAPVPSTPFPQTPVAMPNPAAVAPGLAAGMPGLPAMPATAVLPPISYEQLTETYANLAAAGLIDAQKMLVVYAELGVNPAELGTNETGRRAVYDRLVQIGQQPAGLPGA